MTPLDRAAVLRQADSLVRQGQVDRAIEEYVRIVEDRPRDWSAVNALGDLYMRAGRVDEAIEQFARIADGVASEGFVSRAIAFYRKILKLAPDHERAQRRVTELQAEKDREPAGLSLKAAAVEAVAETIEPASKPAPVASPVPASEPPAPAPPPVTERRAPVSGSTIDEVFALLRDEAQQEPEFRDVESRIDDMINSRTRG